MKKKLKQLQKRELELAETLEGFNREIDKTQRILYHWYSLHDEADFQLQQNAEEIERIKKVLDGRLP